ncbi:amidohydrolase family protein [Thermoactinomyces mirandus]|nr:amidohydrolase family protein [Thermoactinomyces mirandus]
MDKWIIENASQLLTLEGASNWPVTINAAHAIARAHEIGSLEAGIQADLVVMNAPNVSYLQYHYRVNPVERVMRKGNRVDRGEK